MEMAQLLLQRFSCYQLGRHLGVFLYQVLSQFEDLSNLFAVFLQVLVELCSFEGNVFVEPFDLLFQSLILDFHRLYNFVGRGEFLQFLLCRVLDCNIA